MTRLVDGEEPRAVVEVVAEGGETVTLELEPSSEAPRISSPGRRVLHLPSDADAALPRRPRAGRALDVVLVVDTTRRHLLASGEESRRVRLLDSEAWAEERRALDTWIGQLQSLGEPADDAGSAQRMAVLGFGDQPAPFPVAEDLRPAFHLAPAQAERRFDAIRPGLLDRTLEALPSSSGGDAVDAVADALHAAASLPWRQDARRLAVLLGDSPGYSIDHPAPRGAAWGARRRDVESAARRLFDRQIELATVFVGPPDEAVTADAWRGLLRHTESQYRRLASIPSWALSLRGFDPQPLSDLTTALRHRPDFLGRGPTLGLFT